ncbi:MAG TPA: polyprenyl synthetase family protein [Acholeplasmataceae bacterium]|jgi:geranylgeranyl diphosphate synthase type II|nr:polyprenyl synthetase family protein [Acholeplasmataceae bacterium]
MELHKLIDAALAEYVATIANPELKAAIEYALFPGGKRLRPLLLLSILADAGVDVELGFYPAAAVEMIHTYSLIHDDLPAMDDDDFRRGQPTLHRKYGEAIAILAADALLTDAFAMIARTPVATETALALIRLASGYCGGNGMVSGQALDILSVNKKLNLSDIETIYERKTKDLFSLAVLSAAEIAAFPEPTKAALEEFSRYFGLAFQIKDDLDDLLIHKDGKSDLETNKATYPIIVGIEPAREIYSEYKEKALVIVKKTLGEKQTYQIALRNL